MTSIFDCTAAQVWIHKFHNEIDRNIASQILGSLVFVSSRRFETEVENILLDLQNKLGETIGIYPITSPVPEGLVGFDPFLGGLASQNGSSKNVGKRKQYGSEDRVGHMLTKLQNRFKRANGTSPFEVIPTVKQIKTQGIKHVVLVDDLCGSGKRFGDYWKKINRSIKSMMSRGAVKLWLVFFAISPMGFRKIKRMLPQNFPSNTRIKSVISKTKLKDFFSLEMIDLCTRYAEKIGIRNAPLGYRDSIMPIVFEHGCPNNLPPILWFTKGKWKPLFPNGSVGTELRPYFDDNDERRLPEILWKLNQPKLALRLLASVEQNYTLRPQMQMAIAVTAAIARGTTPVNIQRKFIISAAEAQKALNSAARSGLISPDRSKITDVGRRILEAYRGAGARAHAKVILGKDPFLYYPSSCEGKLR